MDVADLSIKALEDAFCLPSYSKFPVSLERGEGSYVWDHEGRRYLDLYGGHAVCLLGHSPHRIVDALKAQAEKLMFYSNMFYQSARAEAARDLCKYVGGEDMTVFFCNSGAEANENALKLAFLLTGRSKVLSFERSFHGRTQGALSVTGIEKYRKRNAPDVAFAKFGDIEHVASLLSDDTACVIVESIQSLAGVHVASRDFFKRLKNLCVEKGALLVMDEVQTGLGRTGSRMYFHHMDVQPDLVTMAKGLASGFPIGATLLTKQKSQQIKVGDLGSTFGGNPMGCALISETLKILEENKLAEHARKIGEWFKVEFERRNLGTYRGQGLLIGLETRRRAQELSEALLDQGIIVGTSLDPHAIRLLPPLNIKQEELAHFLDTLEGLL